MMKLDFTRETFDPRKHFLRVIMQQGRVQVDADMNEQIAILLHYLQTLATDLIGPYAGPTMVDGQSNTGFLIGPTSGNLPDLTIGPGRYYVAGLLCENERTDLTYFTQPDYPMDPDWRRQHPLPGPPYLVYLDVWERAITGLEDPTIREVALGGPDTAARSRVVWQVKIAELGDLNITASCDDVGANWGTLVDTWQPRNRGLLRARTRTTPDNTATDPCITPPDARYRGDANQLYRVEIHTGGPIPEVVRSRAAGGSKGRAAGADGPTFKWSRDNGAVVFPIRAPAGQVVTLENLGRDSRMGLQAGDWVEIVDDDYVLWNGEEPYYPQLFRIETVDPIRSQVTLNDTPPGTVGSDPAKHPLLRRWDQNDTNSGDLVPTGGAIAIREDVWLDLEDGIQIQFRASDLATRYRPGDYWLIPARTATGDVEWPTAATAANREPEPVALPPQGITHQYAPLAVFGDAGAQEDCRCLFEPLECNAPPR
jgi:hypothetical protein